MSCALLSTSLLFSSTLAICSDHVVDVFYVLSPCFCTAPVAGTGSVVEIGTFRIPKVPEFEPL